MKYVFSLLLFLVFFASPVNYVFAGDQKKDHKKSACVHNDQLFDYHLQTIILPVVVEKIDWHPDTLTYTLSCVFYDHMSDFNYRVSDIEKEAQRGGDSDRIVWQKRYGRHELEFFCYDKKAYDRLPKDQRKLMSAFTDVREVEVDAIVRPVENQKKPGLVDKYLSVAQKLWVQFNEKILPHPPTPDDIAHAMGFVSSNDAQFKSIERSAEKVELSVTKTEKKDLSFFLGDFQNKFWYMTFCPFCGRIFSMHSSESIDNLSFDSFMRVRQIPVQVTDLQLDTSDMDESYLDISGVFANSGSHEYRLVHFRLPLSLSNDNFALTLRVKKGDKLSVLPSGNIRSYIIEHARNQVWVMYVYVKDLKNPTETARLIQLTHIDR